MSVIGIQEILLSVKDMKKSLSFYHEIIGIPIDKQDEEHRVWYVGVTRTKQNLYIMAAKKENQGYDIESLV